MRSVVIILDLEILVEEAGKIGDPQRRSCKDPTKLQSTRRELTTIIVRRRTERSA